MKAILTTDGSIKIILSNDDKLDDKIKEKFLSKETSCAVSSKESSFKSMNTPISLQDIFQEPEEGEEHLEFKQAPRQVFMSTICHVSRS